MNVASEPAVNIPASSVPVRTAAARCEPSFTFLNVILSRYGNAAFVFGSVRQYEAFFATMSSSDV